jgi:hypothetical protein
MKIRSGFVSNSSSSSFVIAQKMTGVCKCCGRSELDLEKMILRSNSSDNSISEDWESYLYDCEEHNDKKTEIDKYASNPEYKVFGLEVSYHDEFLNDFIQNSEDIIVLFQEGD